MAFANGYRPQFPGKPPENVWNKTKQSDESTDENQQEQAIPENDRDRAYF